MTIVDAETLTCTISFWMSKLINTFDGFCQIATCMANYLEKLILVEAFWDPESYIFIACGELRISLELCDLSLLELVYETLIFTPKQPDILNVKELHGPTLKT